MSNGFAVFHALHVGNGGSEPHCSGCLKSVIASLKKQNIPVLNAHLCHPAISCCRIFPQKHESGFWRVLAQDKHPGLRPRLFNQGQLIQPFRKRKQIKEFVSMRLGLPDVPVEIIQGQTHDKSLHPVVGASDGRGRPDRDQAQSTGQDGAALRTPAATVEVREPVSPRCLPPSLHAGWQRLKAGYDRLNDSPLGDFLATLCFCGTALLTAIFFMAE